MGMPGSVTIKITTSFNKEENSVSRSIQIVDWYGLNGLSVADLGTGESWEMNRDLITDTIELPDGVHKLEYQKTGWVVLQEN